MLFYARITVLLLTLFVMLTLAGAAPISTCGIVNENSYLTQDLVFANGICLTYTSGGNPSITIDCRGHTIRGTSTSTTAFSLVPPSPNSLIIKNCKVKDVGKGLESLDGGSFFSSTILNSTFQNISDTVFWDISKISYDMKNVSVVAEPSAYITRFFTGLKQMHAVNSSFLGSKNYLIYDSMSFVEMFNSTLPYPLNIIGELAYADNHFRVMYAPYVKVIFLGGSPAMGARIYISNSSGHQYYSDILTDSQGKTVRLPLNMSTWYPPSMPFAPFLENSENPYTIEVSWGSISQNVSVIVNESNEIVIVLQTIGRPPSPINPDVNGNEFEPLQNGYITRFSELWFVWERIDNATEYQISMAYDGDLGERYEYDPIPYDILPREFLMQPLTGNPRIVIPARQITKQAMGVYRWKLAAKVNGEWYKNDTWYDFTLDMIPEILSKNATISQPRDRLVWDLTKHNLAAQGLPIGNKPEYVIFRLRGITLGTMCNFPSNDELPSYCYIQYPYSENRNYFEFDERNFDPRSEFYVPRGTYEWSITFLEGEFSYIKEVELKQKKKLKFGPIEQ